KRIARRRGRARRAEDALSPHSVRRAARQLRRERAAFARRHFHRRQRRRSATMNATLVIARRELAEKRFVFVTALAFLALALIVPFMPGVHDGERAGALIVGSLILATALSVGLAAILGGSIVGRELSDGRLSFYFSKPIPATAIWWGKLLAAATLIVASFGIVGFPALVAGGAAALSGWTAEGTWSIFAFILFGAGALFLLSHVIATLVRSRSAWFLFDFVAAVICGTAMWMLMRALLAGFAGTLTLRL